MNDAILDDLAYLQKKLEQRLLLVIALVEEGETARAIQVLREITNS